MRECGERILVRRVRGQASDHERPFGSAERELPDNSRKERENCEKQGRWKQK